ncbi:MAG TPA: alpha/beta fold hydrolase [Burkholderiales bacterium]|nr:alpha/beta fold hydrolase [Burkholderiales bacterium]
MQPVSEPGVLRDAILVHGLWMRGLVMRPLAARLARAGVRCHLLDYTGRERPLAANAERLAHLARQVGPAHFVGHSLGGLVVLDALTREPSLPVGRVALLGTPARGCLAARRLARFGFGRWLLGESEALWREGRTAHWKRPEQLGVIAGTVPIGMGRVFAQLPCVNDGVVCVEETRIDGMTACSVLPVSHSGMLLSARVAESLFAFLKRGSFPQHAR